MTTVAIDEQTARQLQHFAEQSDVSLDDLVEQAIRGYLRVEAERILEREAKAFAAMHANLLQEHMDKYVAIHHGQLVDSDSDQGMLVLRMTERFPDEVILVRQVRTEVEPTFVIRSPRIVRD